MFLLSLTTLALASDDRVPEFELRDLDNKKHALSDYAGKPVLLNFWATWCTACRLELSELQELYEAYADDGLVVLAISIDDARSKSQVKPLVRSQQWTFQVLLDTQTQVVSQLHPSKELPYFGLVSPEGELLWKRTTYAPGDSCLMAKRLETVLEGMTPTAEAFCAEQER